MARMRRYQSAATVSWIAPGSILDNALKLGMVDLPVISSQSSKNYLVGNKGYRFVNFVEAYIEYDDSNYKLWDAQFSSTSGIYKDLSAFGIPSQIYELKREISGPPKFGENTRGMIFTQTVGARTVSPETAGRVVGAVSGQSIGLLLGMRLGLGATLAEIGRATGEQVGLAVAKWIVTFPPIWSTVRVTIPAKGDTSCNIMRHSLFPCVTFYKQPAITARPGSNELLDKMKQPFEIVGNAPHYSATELDMQRWLNMGWDKMGQNPELGNPWGIKK